MWPTRRITVEDFDRHTFGLHVWEDGEWKPQPSLASPPWLSSQPATPAAPAAAQPDPTSVSQTAPSFDLAELNNMIQTLKGLLGNDGEEEEEEAAAGNEVASSASVAGGVDRSN